MNTEWLYFLFSTNADQILFGVLCFAIWLGHDRLVLRHYANRGFRASIAAAVCLFVSSRTFVLPCEFARIYAKNHCEIQSMRIISSVCVCE